MTQQIINIGTVANDGTGDTLRIAGGKINSNFTEVYNNVSVANVTAQAAFNAANAYSLFDLSFTQSAYNQSNTAMIMAQNSYNTANNTDYNITANVAILRGEITGNVANLRSEITANAASANAVINTGISANVAILRGEITANISSVDANVASVNTNVTNLTTYSQAAFNTANTVTANITFTNATISGDSNSSVTILTSELINQYTSIELYKNGDLNLYANSNVSIYTDSEFAGYRWKFGDNGILTFPNGSTQSGGMMNLVSFKALVASSSDFSDFQTKVAAL